MEDLFKAFLIIAFYFAIGLVLNFPLMWLVNVMLPFFGHVLTLSFWQVYIVGLAGSVLQLTLKGVAAIFKD